MSRCTKCDSNIKSHDHFCSNCGEINQVYSPKIAKKNRELITALFILVFLVILMLWFLFQDRSENARSNLLEVKPIQTDNTVDNDPLLQHLGLTKTEIVQLYGEAEIIEHWGPGGEVYFYADQGLYFIFAGQETNVVNNIMITTDYKKPLLGVQVGMTFKEIESIIGIPLWSGHLGENSDFGEYGMTYHLGKQRENESEIEVHFFAPGADDPTSTALILWKAFWW